MILNKRTSYDNKMKDKILICLYAYFPFENANTNVIYPLIKRLSKDYDIEILTKKCAINVPNYEQDEDGFIIRRYKPDSYFRAVINNLADYDVNADEGSFKKNLLHLLTPVACVLQKCVKRNEYRELKKVLASNNYKFVITTCESFESHYNMLMLKKNSKNKVFWIAYFMDPFSQFIKYINVKGKMFEHEKEVYKMSDMVLVTEEIYLENHINEFKQYIYKTFPFKFGNFKLNNQPINRQYFVNDKINCVYVGSLLNKKIRDPQYLYKIINNVGDKFHFCIICNKPSDINITQFKSEVLDKSKVSWYENMPLSECLTIMNSCDILINLGNKSTNQTPSKVFDYIGTGKPIVNIYSLESDTSKRYLSNYPNKINIFEDDKKVLENSKKFKEFCEKNIGKQVSYYKLIKIYSDYLSENAIEETVKCIIMNLN